MKTRTDDHFYRQDGADLPGKKLNRSRVNRFFDYAPNWAPRLFRDPHVRTSPLFGGQFVSLNVEPLNLATEDQETREHDAQRIWKTTAPLAEHLVANMMGGRSDG